MSNKTVPFTKEEMEKIIETYPTPFHIYDKKAIVDNIRRLKAAFSWAPEFKEYFAVKATPNPRLLEIFKEEGLGTDCSSLPELVLSEQVGIVGEDIMFSSNNTPMAEYDYAIKLGAILNLDDISHIEYIERKHKLPKTISFRYNPGPLRDGNELIGKPEEAKYGLTKDQIIEAYRICKEKGVEKFGLHTMVVSNELNPEYFAETAKMMFDLIVEVYEKTGVKISFVDLGGGIGIPYKPDQDPMDLEYVSGLIKKMYDDIIVPAGLAPLKIMLECGRMVTGPYGYLVTKAIHYKDTYRHYIGVDASMANLMRPGMYGAYHHITVLGKEDAPHDHVYDVVGSLCENCDKFAIQRELPKIDEGDILVIHDAGAHGHSMGFNYNAKLRSAELLLNEDHSVTMIRRAETMDDLFATLKF
ncbi:MAG: diaminopimelate decarboxylase [Peptococcaceae bacterium]|nr:diaminopimelate decarboxylase [Peptococcaceae bacterium]